jgi:hypothetical protein
MTIDDWLRAACADAKRRGLAELTPLLEALARSTTTLRRADAEIASAPEAESSAGKTP